MGKLKLKTNPKVSEKFAAYPERVRGKMKYLWELVIETAVNLKFAPFLHEALHFEMTSCLQSETKTRNPSTILLRNSLIELPLPIHTRPILLYQVTTKPRKHEYKESMVCNRNFKGAGARIG
jgi:hypothetical protein